MIFVGWALASPGLRGGELACTPPPWKPDFSAVAGVLVDGVPTVLCSFARRVGPEAEEFQVVVRKPEAPEERFEFSLERHWAHAIWAMLPSYDGLAVDSVVLPVSTGQVLSVDGQGASVQEGPSQRVLHLLQLGIRRAVEEDCFFVTQGIGIDVRLLPTCEPTPLNLASGGVCTAYFPRANAPLFVVTEPEGQRAGEWRSKIVSFEQGEWKTEFDLGGVMAIGGVLDDEQLWVSLVDEAGEGRVDRIDLRTDDRVVGQPFSGAFYYLSRVGDRVLLGLVPPKTSNPLRRNRLRRFLWQEDAYLPLESYRLRARDHVLSVLPTDSEVCVMWSAPRHKRKRRQLPRRKCFPMDELGG